MHRRRVCSVGEVLVLVAVHEDVSKDSRDADAEKMLVVRIYILYIYIYIYIYI